jgi:phosphopantetheinyl transferase
VETVQNEIHVWRVMLDEIDQTWAETFLSQEEQAHCSNFRLASPRAEFVRSRAAVRHVCSDYLDCEPSALQFHQNAFGKLEISDLPIDFSVSHSNAVALVAVAPCAVGVDLELIDSNFDWRSVVDRFFTPAEVQYISQARPKDQVEKFLQCWTRREAFVKALGTGDPTVAPELLSNRIFDSGSIWSIENPDIVSGFVCSVVYEGEALPIRVHQWRAAPAQNEKGRCLVRQRPSFCISETSF